MSIRRAFAFLAGLSVLAGCSLLHPSRDAEIAAARAREPLYSPNGEPLRGGPLGRRTCSDALSGWFDRVDLRHDGAIDLDEFLADANRQFAAMDLHHDGIITPPDLAAYRAPYDVDARTADARAADQREADRRDGRGRSGSGERALIEDRPDPVMLADVSLRNRVTLAEFMTYARRNFADLDKNHDLRLGKAEITASCPPGDGS